MTPFMTAPRAIFFDLDGTLVDTAPDLVATINRMINRHGGTARPYHELRPYSTAGAAGLLKAGFNIDSSDPRWFDFRAEFFADYFANIARDSKIYAGVDELLSALQLKNIAWGIITNKVEHLTFELLRHIKLPEPACVVCGDTMAEPKPSVLPMLEAAKRVNLASQDCWYVGDDPRDGIAAEAAQMPFIAVDYGYGVIPPDGALKRISNALDLLKFLS